MISTFEIGKLCKDKDNGNCHLLQGVPPDVNNSLVIMVSYVNIAVRVSCKTVLSSLLLLVLTVGKGVAQEDTAAGPPEPLGYIGLFGGITLNSHSVSLDPFSLTGGPPAPTERLFTEGSGTGWIGGLLVEFPLSDIFGVGARLSMQQRGGEMTAQYENRVDVTTPGGTVRPAMVEATVPSSLNYLSLTPHLRVMPESLPLYLFAGPSLLVPLTTTYDYSEQIVSDGGLIFPGVNGPRRTRVTNGAVPKPDMKLGAAVGVGVEIGLTDQVYLLLDAQYAPMIGDITTAFGSDRDWRADMISFTLGLKTGFGRRRAEPPPPPPPPDTAVVEDTVTRIEAKGVTDEGLVDTLVARSQQVQQTEVHALLPYIFFERDSAAIPARYKMIDRRDVRTWQEERIERGSTMNVYYEILNVIGYRLRTRRTADITITGCVGQFEMADSSLALRRAEAVRDYLRDVWRIREDRMQVIARGLPNNPSLSEVDTLEGDVENQRVEIHSTMLSMLEPVRLPDTLLLEPAGTIRLLPPVSDVPDSIAQLESWQVDVMVGDSVIQRAATGFGPPPEQIDLELKSRPDLNRRGPIEITSELIILDSLYTRRLSLPSTTVWFVEEGGFRVDRSMEEGMYVDRYNLLLYSFDSAGIFDFSQQAAMIMDERISPDSEVTITGYTDRIGLPYYNKRLATHRAERAAQIMGLEDVEIIGVGERDTIYNNDYPEGRYYSRTVVVEIRTPIRGGRTDTTGATSITDTTTTDTVTVETEEGEGAPDAPPTEEAAGTTVNPAGAPQESAAGTSTTPRRRESEEVPTSVTLPAEDERK